MRLHRLSRGSTTISDRLRAYRPPFDRWASWQALSPQLREHDYAAVRRLLLDRHLPPEDKDVLLSGLVRCARDDTEAVVCVTACLYPGLSRIAHRYSDILGWDDAWSCLAEALFRNLQTFDLERQPQFLAAALLHTAANDVRRAVRSERKWRDRVQLQAVPTDLLLPLTSTDASDPLVDGAPLTPLDAALITSTRLGGLGLREAAALLGLSYEAAKKRRQRAEAAWVGSSGRAA